MKGEPRVAVTLRLPPALSKRLQKLAEAHGRSMNALLVEWLQKGAPNGEKR
jgi:predicted transcriptional regulator